MDKFSRHPFAGTCNLIHYDIWDSRISLSILFSHIFTFIFSVFISKTAFNYKANHRVNQSFCRTISLSLYL